MEEIPGEKGKPNKIVMHHIDSNSSRNCQTNIGPTKNLHECKVCSIGFKYKYLLEKHFKTHSDLKELIFGCEFCKKRFARKNELVYHLRIHTGEEPYKCGQCPESFKRSQID